MKKARRQRGHGSRAVMMSALVASTFSTRVATPLEARERPRSRYEEAIADVIRSMRRGYSPASQQTAMAEPFNASGGSSLLGDKLERGEEVIALKRRSESDGQIQVGDNNAGYDVLRWNGACATIHDGDFAEDRPSHIVQSKVEWRRLGVPQRQHLEHQPAISAAYEARRKSCHGFSMGRVSGDCESNDKLLMQEVVRYIQSGHSLPEASRMP